MRNIVMCVLLNKLLTSAAISNYVHCILASNIFSLIVIMASELNNAWQHNFIYDINIPQIYMLMTDERRHFYKHSVLKVTNEKQSSFSMFLLKKY